MIYVQTSTGLQNIGQNLTKEKIIAALGYTPADGATFYEDESGALVVADSKGYVIARIDENGYFHGILFDKYDFSSDYDYISNPLLAAANNYFCLLQKTLDRNFYVLTPIMFKW